MSNPIELPSSDRGQSSRSLSDELVIPYEDKADFVEFTVKISKENLSPNTVQRAIQTQFDDKGLNQFMVSVEQKVIPDTEWQPTCGDMTVDDLKIGGNCLFEALRDAGISEENVFNLRSKIASAQKNALANICSAVEIWYVINSATNSEIAHINEIIYSIIENGVVADETFGADLFQGMTADNIGAAIEYVSNQGISFWQNITNEHLGEILKILGVFPESSFLTETLNSNEVFIRKSDTLNLMRSLCGYLISLRELKQKQSPFEEQGPLNSDLLLNVIQYLYSREEIHISSSENVTGFLSNVNGNNNKDLCVTKKICEMYNNLAQDENKMILNEQGLPFEGIIERVIALALTTVITGTQNKYIGEEDLQYVADILECPILLLNTEGTEEKGNGLVRPGNILSGSILYSPNSPTQPCPIDRLGSLALPEDTKVIALKPGHFVAESKFAVHRLSVLVEGQKKPIHSFNGLLNAFNETEELTNETPPLLSPLWEHFPAELADSDVFTSTVAIQRLFSTQRGEPSSFVQSELTRFQDRFIPYLQSASKNWQAVAEVENLRHIQSCAEEMLREDGLNFKPEFVAKIVCERLRMAMFGAGQLDDAINMGNILDEGENKYQPSCMWDFGPERATILLKGEREGESYHWDGVLASPRPQEEQSPADQQNNTENRFSILRGRGEKGDYYAMPNGEITPSLGARFRQFLAFQSKISGGFSPTDDIEKLLTQIPNDFESDESAGKILGEVQRLLSAIDPNQVENGVVKELLSITCNDILKPLIEKVKAKLPGFHLNENTPLTELPPSLMFLVGLQFGQNQVGSWNPFTLAVKRYFAYQFADETQSFFWPQEYHQPPEEMGNVLQYSFTDLIAKIWPGREFDVAIAEQFENAIIAYYAITQEILSRSEFPGNNQGIYLGKVMRLEDMGAIEAMTFGEGKFQGAVISSNAERPVLVAGSVGAHVTSLDRVNDFPPPMRIITKYEQVHHAHIFGVHLFNVDFSNAARVIGRVFDDERSTNRKVGEYTGGCPFFRERQRETLLIPRGLQAEICGVLASAEDQDHAYVLANSDEYDDGRKREVQIEDIASEKARHQIEFCKSPDTKNKGTILKDHKIRAAKAPKPRDEDAYNPAHPKTRNNKENDKYQRGLKAMKNLTNIGKIVQALKFETIYHNHTEG
ncbi:MAG: hypothetical protein LBE98_03240 [Puniceicoccales bacterium]|jgi:hypothetical protein|nr:hypothetical protein [Puniceicoccales bacterium]